ncbi:hypothetical protein V1517DRAFT_323208 [Lipomyces orientalis]|uniref:Uncharacterized protein n=1 Tax=Lipomyces orientalis TaxID=1233043 RepID=A0ACC3TMV3_9ASCO
MASGVGIRFLAVFTVLFLYILFCFLLITFLFRQCRFVACPTRSPAIDSISDEEWLGPNMPPRRNRRDRRSTYLPSDVSAGFNFDVIPTVNLLSASNTEADEVDDENVWPTVEEFPRLLNKLETKRSARPQSRLSITTAKLHSRGLYSISSAEISPDPRFAIVQSLSIPTVRLRHMQPFPESKVKMNLQKLLSLSVEAVAGATAKDNFHAPNYSATSTVNTELEPAPEGVLATNDHTFPPQRKQVLTDATRAMIGHDEWADQRRAIANLLLDRTNLDSLDEERSIRINWKTWLAVVGIFIFIGVRYWVHLRDIVPEPDHGTSEQVK